MNKVMLIGRSGCGKTTLTQALNGEGIHYSKTQSVERGKFLIDTPGEYVESRNFGGALAVYAYESDIVGFLLSADEPYSLYSPNITSMANRPVIGIVTGIDRKNANADRAVRWLELAGCKRIFKVSAVTGEGIEELKHFLSEFDTKRYYKTRIFDM
ncbi:MAG: EutP/PduV family microcompartment system protein [Clostridia bacterium]|nr:EutP/PduV family microcompartment system protein [Clostridia bacterium]